MKRLLLSALCAVPAFCIGQTLLYNDGAMIKVQNGATLYVEGGIQNTATGTIDNDGTIEVKGNFINAGIWEPSQSNTLKFTGNVQSDVTSGTAKFQKVVIQKDATFNVNLMDNMTIDTSLNFTATGSNRLLTNGFDLKLGTMATVLGYDADEYIATTGTHPNGVVQKAVAGNSTFEFPIGDATNYSPISSTYTGTAYSGTANIRAKANDLTHPNKPTDATDYISRYWDVDASGITTYSNTLSGTYIPADVVGTAALVKGAVYGSAAWKYAGADAGVNTAIGSTTETTADFTGTNFFGKADIIVYLHGAYIDGTGTMTTTMNTSGIIPTTSPYVDAPAIVGAIPANVTDWIKIELRDPASPSTVLGKASVFLKNDGHVVGLDGTSLPIIKNGKPTSIVNFVHWSHLPVRTPNAGLNVVDPTLYNFSDGIGQAYDNPAVTTNDAMRLMSDGNYVMWGGNANSNTNVRYTTGSGDEAYLLGTVLGGNTGTIISGLAAYSSANMNMNQNIRYTTGSGDEAFLLGNALGGNTGTIINQHQ